MENKVREIRKSRGLTRTQLANLIGKSQSYISEVETGTKRINGDLLDDFAKALDVSVSDLIADSDFPLRKTSAPLWENQAFTISHADNSPFVGEGLRAFFEYRDLGIKSATKGKFGAHVIRAVPGVESPGTWHTHDLDFQMVYVTKGWVVFEYQGQGEHMLRAGSCVLQPPGITHREVRHSDDLELIEIISPADFATTDAAKG